jgi:long-chain acyl-CoA synthetase
MPQLLLDDCLRWHSRRTPKKVALDYLGKRTTYWEFNARVNRLSNGLLSLGINRNDHVALLAYNSREALEICFALARIGSPFVPINYRLSVREMLEYGLRMNCRNWIIGEGFESVLMEMLPTFKEFGVRHIITMGAEQGGTFVAYEDLLSDSSSSEAEVDVQESDCFWIMATGGTTGLSKGVMKSHREWVLSLLFGLIEFGINESDRTLAVSPLCYGAGSYMAHMVLYVGGSVSILPKFEPETVLRTIRDERITVLFMVPTMYKETLGLAHEIKRGYDVSSIRTLISAGSSLLTNTKEAILDYFKGAGLHEYYGASDLSIVTNLRPADQVRKLRSVGKPILGMEVNVLDERGRPVITGEIGELHCRGHGLPMGYYTPEEGERLLGKGWASAGDLAKEDDEGYCYIVDRKKDMIISGGINIYPMEIEEILSQHTDILEVAVVGIPSEKWGEEIAAFVVRREGSELDAKTLLDYCGERLSRYKLPRTVSFLAALPKNTAGKILKRKLKEEFWRSSEIKVS